MLHRLLGVQCEFLWALFKGYEAICNRETTSMRPDCTENLQVSATRLSWPALPGACSAHQIFQMICCLGQVKCSHSCHLQRQPVRICNTLMYIWFCAAKFFWFLLYMTLTLTWYTCEYLLPCMVVTSPEPWFSCFLSHDLSWSYLMKGGWKTCRCQHKCENTESTVH